MRRYQTPSQTLGPFFAYGLVPQQYGYRFTSIADNSVAAPGTEGDRIRIIGQVRDGEDTPVPDALLEFWQAKAHGRYNHPADDRQDNLLDPDFKGFGGVGTGTSADASFQIDTVKPGAVDDRQAPHINVVVMMRGLLTHAFTRIYFSDLEALNATDLVLAQVPEDRRSTLIAQRDETAPGTLYRIDIRLQGERETLSSISRTAMTDPFQSEIYGGLFAPPEIKALFSDTHHVRTMLVVEAALARVQAELGIIPAGAGAEIVRAIDGFEADYADLATGTASAGLPVPALVAQLRAAVGGEAAQYVHWGATSQDIMDTALVLVLREVSASLASNIATLSARLAEMAKTHRATVMLARTRSQQAAPTTFGLKAAGWRAPLVRHSQRLRELETRLLVVQFGGAAGTLAPLDHRGIEVMEGLAKELELNVPAMPWHTQRDGLGEFAGWLATLSGALGKIGLDMP